MGFYYKKIDLFVRMLVPPQLDTKERKEHDMNILRIYYMICEDIGMAKDGNVQKSFQCLMNWAGSFKFVEEFTIFREHIDRLKREIQKNK